MGTLYGKKEHLERFKPYKVRPATNVSPESWETGTQVHELIAGIGARWITLRSWDGSAMQERRRGARLWPRLYAATVPYERALLTRLMDGLEALPGIRIFGITDRARFGERCATVSFRSASIIPRRLRRFLVSRGIFTWDGNFYALNLSERLGVELKGGVLRVGLVHYNTAEEVDRLIAALKEFVAG